MGQPIELSRWDNLRCGAIGNLICDLAIVRMSNKIDGLKEETYHINTTVSCNGDDRVERAEVDTYYRHLDFCVSVSIVLLLMLSDF